MKVASPSTTGTSSLAAELALPHRMKKQPFQDSVMSPEQLENNMRQRAGRGRRGSWAMMMNRTLKPRAALHPMKKKHRGR